MGELVKNRRARRIVVGLAVLVGYVALALVTCWVVSQNGSYPRGSDTMFHVYRGNAVYQSLRQGVPWPLVDPLWYNGVELLRFWAPLPAYAMAGCQALAAGDPFHGYLVFCGLVLVVGGLCWYHVGARLGRPALGAFLGAAWFFAPNNLIDLFYEGNLSRAMILAVLPLFLWWVYAFLCGDSWRRLPQISLGFSFMALCHSGYAGMVALAVIVWLLLWAIVNRSWRRGLGVLAAVACGYLAIGVWLVPSLIGGIASTNSSDVMSTFFQSLWLTINPLDRVITGKVEFYFGLSTFLVCAAGALLSKRKSLPLFWCALITVLLTSQSAYPLLSSLPGGQYLWMLRFLSIAIAMVFLGLLTWSTLRRGVLVAMCVLLALDVVPSLSLVYGDLSGRQPAERLSEEADQTLIAQAKQVTRQRMSLIDGSSLGSTGPYIIAAYDQPVAMSQGAGWQSAATATNIMRVNSAAEQGLFPYLFDRSLELGCDTVLVRTGFVRNYSFSSQQEMDAAAQAVGYQLVASNGSYRLYHLDGAPDTWGTVNHYEAIGIGTGASALSLSYPQIEETSDTNLNHYGLDELSGYKTVYLSGFTYDDQSAAEELIEQLAQRGVRVIISADGIPVDQTTHDRIFLGVRCNDVNFSNAYPELHTKVGTLNCEPFPQGSEDWHTVYLEGLDQSWGTFSMEGDEGSTGAQNLDFVGTVKSDNIIMVGLNLGYYYSLTQDPGAGQLLDAVMGGERGSLPERDIVPLQVSFAPDGITVSSDTDDVNTTLAYHDEFAQAAGVSTRNNLVHVNAGTTVLPLFYPHLGEGLAVSAVGIVGLAALTLAVRRVESSRPTEGKAPRGKERT